MYLLYILVWQKRNMNSLFTSEVEGVAYAHFAFILLIIVLCIDIFKDHLRKGILLEYL